MDPHGPPMDPHGPPWTPVDPPWDPRGPPWTPMDPPWTPVDPRGPPMGPLWTPMDPPVDPPWTLMDPHKMFCRITNPSLDFGYEEESVRGKLRALVEDKREICPGCDLCFCINKAFLKISKLGVRVSDAIKILPKVSHRNPVPLATYGHQVQLDKRISTFKMHSAELTNSFSESRGCWYLSCDGVNGQGRSTPGESYPALAPHRYGLHPNIPDTCHFTPGDPAGKTAHTLCKEQGVPAFLCRQKQQKLLPFPGAAQSTP
ncbi:hypothetical protein MJT46_012135 [Ovis ammon polii x Ovis aries]|nr:hypothetical protein MJT46_012135 [Ovis ammon polii x Ovis aries]